MQHSGHSNRLFVRLFYLLHLVDQLFVCWRTFERMPGSMEYKRNDNARQNKPDKALEKLECEVHTQTVTFCIAAGFMRTMV